MADFSAMNEVYRVFRAAASPRLRPLPQGVRVEIDAIARVG